MKHLFITTLLLLGISNVAHAASPHGLWLTENERSVIRMHHCGDNVCGKIVWIVKGGLQHDVKNPQENLRGQPMCGLQIMQGFLQKPNTFKEWVGGKIYKADDGDIYNANFKLVEDNKLKVRGYVGLPMFGKSQTWTRVNAKDYPTCVPAQKK